MNAIFWFWIGAMVGGFVGFGCFCLLQTTHDLGEEAEDTERTADAEVHCHAEH